MRTKLIAIATAVAALALGASLSTAALTSKTEVAVKIKKAGAPATAKITIVNSDPGIVPQPISKIVISSSIAKFNGKAIPQCKSPVPTGPSHDAGPINPPCPSSSKVGTGTFTVNTGTAGGPIPAELGTISGTLNYYNYKTGSGQQATFLLEIKSDIPVRNAHVYQLATIKNGTITATVPKMSELPKNIADIISPPGAPRVIALNTITTNIKPPKSKKPFFTLKNLKNLSFSVTLERDAG